MFRRQLLTGLLMTIALAVVLGLLYPLAITAVAQVTMKGKANGSIITLNGKAMGSSLIGQSFADARGNPLPQYFQPRPSAAGSGYDGLASSGSNLGPTNPTLLHGVADRAAAYRRLNGLRSSVKVPIDAVTASGSGLDPDISVANAEMQAQRVARARGLRLGAVLDAVRRHVTTRVLGFLGEDRVNVLELNLALDALRS